MLLGHGAVGSSRGPGGQGAGGGGAAGLGAAGPAGTPVDLREQAGPGGVLLIVLQEQAAGLLVEGRLGVRVDQQALDGLWAEGQAQAAGPRGLQAGRSPFPTPAPNQTLAQLTPCPL